MVATDWTEERADGAEERLVGLRLAETVYGIPIEQVREIIRYQRPVRLPGAPGYVEGVLSIRGQTVPIVDLRALPAAGAGSGPRDADRALRRGGGDGGVPRRLRDGDPGGADHGG